MDSEYYLAFRDLKEHAGFQGSNATVHRLRKFGLIDHKKDGTRYRYSEKSVIQLKLIPELKKYAFNDDNTKEAFENISLKVLEEKVGKLSPDELRSFIASHRTKG